MAKSKAFAEKLVAAIFDGGRWPVAGEFLYVSLHTGMPEAQDTHETSYQGYRRIAISRRGGFARSGAKASPKMDVDFPECGGDPGAALTHVGIGTSADGHGLLLYAEAVDVPITMKRGIVPRWKKESSISED